MHYEQQKATIETVKQERQIGTERKTERKKDAER